MAHRSKVMSQLKNADATGAWSLLMPTVAILIFALVVPSLLSIINSFYDWNLLKSSQKQFGGFANYTKILNDATFRKSLVFTFGFIAITMPIEIILGLATATAVSKLSSPLRKILTTIFFIPYLLSPLTVGLIWKLLFTYEGLINGIIVLLGGESIVWLNNSVTATIACTIAEVWRSYPFGFLILTSAISTFPIEPYEASKVDGASKIQTFLFLTLPFCKPALIIILVYQIVLKLRVFDLVYLLSGGGPVDTTTPLGYLIYKYYFRYYDGGLGAATAVIVFICSIIISIVIINNLKTGDKH